MGEINMSAYEEPSEEIIAKLKQYMNKGEFCEVSGTLKLNGKSYREVIFLKKSFIKNERVGFLYLDEDYNIVSSQNIQRELGKLGHYYELFYSKDKTVGFLSALLNMDGLERSIGDLDKVVKGLDFLKSQGVEASDNIKDVVTKLPELRKKSNEYTEKLSILIKEIEDKPFDEEKIQMLYPLYEQILKLNFEKVKLIATLERHLDYVKEMAEKKRKKLAFRFNKDLVSSLMKVSYELSYYIRIIKTYKNVLYMTNFQYLKFLSDMNKEKVEKRINSIRQIS